ncbi:MAG: hypothetical protein ABR548_13305 [Actinomycetota bacterium]|nr:hypothetical protein [Actinomycetota bacterium]
MTEPREAALAVLRDADGAELHWTVVWDRALQAALIDPFTQPNARDEFLHALATLAREGTIEKTSTGTYRAAPI